MKINHRNPNPNFLFILIFIVLFFFMGYHKILNLGPHSIHAWRQGDSYTYALTYYYDNNKLLEPEMLFMGDTGSHKAISEFPILYYLTAKIWKLTGVYPLVLKFINFLILITGLFFLMKLSIDILKDRFWAFFVILFLFSSPALGYYSFNFIPNIPAFGLALTGFYFLYKYIQTTKNRYLILASVFYAIGALIKITALLSFMVIHFIVLLNYLCSFKKNILQIAKQLLSIVFVFFIVLLWYPYAINYTQQNIPDIYTQSIRPIWELDASGIDEILDPFSFNVLPQYFNPVILIFLAIILFTLIYFHKKTDKRLLTLSVVMFLAFLVFIILFYQAMNVHDYFLINALILIPIIVITFLHTIKTSLQYYFYSKRIRVFALLLLILLLNYNITMTRSHYNPYDPIVKNNIPLNKRQIDFWNFNHYTINQDFEGIISYLRSIGIEYDDLVISAPDSSPNKTLCLMHQKGFTDYYYKNYYPGTEATLKKIELGAKYLIVSGEENLTREDIAPFTSNQIGRYNDIFIYSLSP